MLNTPFSPWPSFSEEEADAVRNVLLSNRVNYWTGDEGKAFEAEFAAWCGSEHAVAIANGTVALDLAWHALGIGPGDEVIVTPRSFVASATTILAVGAMPVFADVDRDSQNITPETVAAVLTPRTRAILAVHHAGWPCDMDGLRELVRGRDIFLVEDCAQAHGARIGGRSVGALGDIAAWSFCQDKIMTTGGEGGMVTTDEEGLWKRVWSMKDHGKSWEAVHAEGHPPGFRWLHETVGTNGRMTETQAVIGRIQLERMDAWHAARTRNAEAIGDALRNTAIFRVPEPPEGVEHAWYKFYLFVRPDTLKAGWSRDRLLQAVTDKGVPCYTGSCPEMYLEAVFANTPSRPRERLPVARELGETSLMLLVHPTLTTAEIDRTREALVNVSREALR